MCSRCIELNPVRAGMVADPGQYRWSSYRHNGLEEANLRLTPHVEYQALGQTDDDRRMVYRSLFRSELDEAALTDIRLALAQGQPLGNSRFSEALCQAAGVKRTQSRRGRPSKPASEASGSDGEKRVSGFEDKTAILISRWFEPTMRGEKVIPTTAHHENNRNTGKLGEDSPLNIADTHTDRRIIWASFCNVGKQFDTAPCRIETRIVVAPATANADVLYGTANADTMRGLAGYLGDDTLEGGAGDGQLDGGAGNDVYLFGRGDGQDTILDTDGTGHDTLRFKAGIAPSEIKVTRDHHHLYMALSGTSDWVTINNGFDAPANRIERFEFADGSTCRADEPAGRRYPPNAKNPAEGAIKPKIRGLSPVSGVSPACPLFPAPPPNQHRMGKPRLPATTVANRRVVNTNQI